MRSGCGGFVRALQPGPAGCDNARMESVRNPAPPLPSLDAWTRYWRSGALHSCSCAFPDNYSGATESFWNERFGALRGGATVVDLGTGNGAIALLAKAAAMAQGMQWRIHGVDRAAIDPAASAGAAARRFEGIVFHPGVSAGTLPFGDAAVDLVTGQYALEYMPREAVTAEIARVLGTRGQGGFVLHARDSVVLSTTAEQLGHCRLLFEDSAIFAHARVMAQVLAHAATPEQRRALAEDPRAQSLRHELNEAAGQVMDRIEQARTPDLLRSAIGAISSTLQAAAALGEEGTLQRLALHEQALRDEWDRLCDLDEAALSPQGIEDLRRRFVDLGYAGTRVGRLQHSPELDLGWTLVVA
jgi:ubiquinone/menaquinone biosynthesis C-methylase UbiE